MSPTLHTLHSYQPTSVSTALHCMCAQQVSTLNIATPRPMHNKCYSHRKAARAHYNGILYWLFIYLFGTHVCCMSNASVCVCLFNVGWFPLYSLHERTLTESHLSLAKSVPMMLFFHPSKFILNVLCVHCDNSITVGTLDHSNTANSTSQNDNHFCRRGKIYITSCHAQSTS